MAHLTIQHVRRLRWVIAGCAFVVVIVLTLTIYALSDYFRASSRGGDLTDLHREILGPVRATDGLVRIELVEGRILSVAPRRIKVESGTVLRVVPRIDGLQLFTPYGLRTDFEQLVHCEEFPQFSLTIWHENRRSLIGEEWQVDVAPPVPQKE